MSLDGVVDRLMAEFLAWLVAAVLTVWEFAINLLRQSAFTTPDVTVVPAVREFAATSVWIVDAAYILAVIAAGVTVMSYQTLQIRYTVKDMLPRLVVGFIAAHWSLPMCSKILELANALTLALVNASVDPWGGWSVTYQRIKTDADAGNIGLFAVVLFVIAAVLMVAIFVMWMMRTAVILVLVGLAPLAMGCYCLPQTEGVARLWWRSMLGALTVQVLQAATFTLGTGLIVAPPADAAGTPVAAGVLGVEGHLLASLVVLILAAKVPGLVGRYVTQSRPGGIVRYASQILLVQRIGRVIGRSHPAAAAATAAAAAGRTRGGGSGGKQPPPPDLV